MSRRLLYARAPAEVPASRLDELASLATFGVVASASGVLSSRSVEPEGRRRRRWLVACSVVLVIVVLGLLPPFLAKERGLLPRAVHFVAQASLLVVTLSLHYEHAERRNRDVKRTLAESALYAAVIGAVGMAAYFIVVRRFGIDVDERFRQVTLLQSIVFGLFMSLLQCSFWALGFVFPFAAEDARLRALEAETHRLEAEKLKLEAAELRASVELALLRSQLEPHFLFNTLNAIAGLVTKQPKEARRLLGSLGELLRDSLREPTEMQTIDEEIAWLRRYAEILESRHADVLRFHWAIAENARRLLIPRLLLQPLVENAVDHGALERAGAGAVTIRIDVDDGEVVCTIEDNGPGLPEGATRAGAFGLHSVRRRLELKYAGQGTLRLDSSTNGTRAVVRLPRMVAES